MKPNMTFLIRSDEHDCYRPAQNIRLLRVLVLIVLLAFSALACLEKGDVFSCGDECGSNSTCCQCNDCDSRFCTTADLSQSRCNDHCSLNCE